MSSNSEIDRLLAHLPKEPGATLLDAITLQMEEAQQADLAEPELKKKTVAELHGKAMELQQLVRVLENKDVKEWLKLKEQADATEFVTVIRTREWEPFHAGRTFGRLEMVLELRASESKTRAMLHELLKELQARQNEQ